MLIQHNACEESFQQHIQSYVNLYYQPSFVWNKCAQIICFKGMFNAYQSFNIFEQVSKTLILKTEKKIRLTYFLLL